MGLDEIGCFPYLSYHCEANFFFLFAENMSFFGLTILGSLWRKFKSVNLEEKYREQRKCYAISKIVFKSSRSLKSRL